MAADSAGATEWTYPVTHSDSGTTIASVHADGTLADASGIGSKTWTFTTSGSAWQIGLASAFYQNTGVGGSALTKDTYTWSQTSSSNPYLSTKASVTNPGTGSAQSAQSTQTLDGYGNVTQAVIYPYNNTTSPLQTFTNEYITDAGYVANYIRNRLLRTRLTLPGGTVKTLRENYYDGKAFGYQTYAATYCVFIGSLITPATPTSGAPTVCGNQPRLSRSLSNQLLRTDYARSAAGREVSQLGTQIARKNLNVQPTIKIPAGYKFNVRVNRDILFEEPYQPVPPLGSGGLIGGSRR